MYLKKIVASGFKSFADKIVIPLDKGITGIVGPNGSGKSNVIDAVRWVMGEQNAKNLRGKVATDIIFSGSSNRKPLGMAEVTLIFDNSDESSFCPPEYRHEAEISLTRRLYVDGQREYLINRKPCRLKDILNFFATTGLGGKSYSMIQQGQVDRILQAKPEEIREILEEAAGTMVYKRRRDDALKKLERTQENLARIEDIVVELERQQGTLKSQMEKARSWQEMTADLKREELSLFAHNYHFYHDQLQEIEGVLKDQTSGEADLIAQIAKLESRQDELQNAIDAADPGLEGLRESVSSIREQIARAESIITTADAKVEERGKRLQELQRTIDDDSQDLAVLEKQYQSAQEEMNAANDKAAELQDLIESFQDQVDEVEEQATVYQNRIEDFQDELRNIDRLLESNTLRCEAINRERDKIANEMSMHEERLEELNRELADTKGRVDAIEIRASKIKEGLDEELNLKSDLEIAIEERNQKLSNSNKHRDELKERYFDTRARFTSLQDMVANASDVASSFRLLKEEDFDQPCLRLGLLTDHIGFAEGIDEVSKHARMAFEKWSERVLVENLGDLNDLVKLAHHHEVGGMPVTVVSELEPLNQDNLRTWIDRCDAEPLRKFLKLSTDNSALNAVLDRLYLVQSLNLSEDDLDGMPHGLVVFTSQGLCFSSRDDFHIGLTGDASGVLSRKAELENLAIELKTVESELAGCQSEIDTLSVKQEDDKLQLSELNKKLASQNQESLEIMSELQSARQLLSHKTELRDTADSQLKGLDAQDRRLIEELSEQGQARLTLGDEQERIRNELEEIKDESTTIEDQRAEVFRVHENRKLELAKLETRAQSIEQSFANTKSQLERMQNALSRKYEEKSRLESEIEEIRLSHKTSMTEMEDLLRRREKLESDLTSKREENHVLLEELRQVDKDLKRVRDEYNKMEKFVSQKQIELERLRAAIAGINEQAIEKYHIDIFTYEFERDPEFDDKKVAKFVQKTRNKIESLGAINMMAIEEYDQLMERLEFIRAQREEVFNSINLLEDALEEIEDTSKNKFLETFDTITREFTNLFPILFPGGEAKLELTSPEDPLNAGVEIIARLPGKKAQRMSLLSGGEKALTAISLIFALLKTKPTPFCFLDEVDAPLDEANVGRYNRVLEALADRFQFIVITHNRRTMEVLDTLFGVTMQEPGVSKVVGVDMQKDIPAHLKKAFKEEGEQQVAGATAH